MNPPAELPPVDVLREMYRTKEVELADGTRRRLHSQVSAEHAGALYRTVKTRRPELVVEVGMAFGGSALSILAGLAETGSGRLISIDPGQHSQFAGAGLANVQKAGFERLHTLIEEPSYAALAQLCRQNTKVDLSYIDGMHTFDYALVDFFLLDKMTGVGGVVAFNDCGYRAIRKVLRYVAAHRKYQKLDVGLARNTQGRNFAVTMARTMMSMSREDEYYAKLEDWEPDWNFFKNF